MYLPPSKTFLKKKIKGFSSNKIAHSQALMNTYFDHEFYFQNNEDLHGTIEENNVNALWNHYVNSGWEEGRFPFQVVVDEIFYIENYPDTSNFVHPQYGALADGAATVDLPSRGVAFPKKCRPCIPRGACLWRLQHKNGRD